VSGDVQGNPSQLSSEARGNCSLCVSGNVRGNRGQCVNVIAREYYDLCVSSNVQERGDPGGGPEPEADYEPAGEKMPCITDENLVLKWEMEARILDPAYMRAQEVPGEQLRPQLENNSEDCEAVQPAGIATHHMGRRRG
jgi:hypothetical protein